MNAAVEGRDPQAEQDHAEFTGWMEAQGNPTDDGYDEYGHGDMREAFTAGMRAARDLAAETEPQPAPDLGAAYADLEGEIRVAVGLHCSGPGVPCDLCLRETDRAMKAIDAYARDVAQHERTREPELTRPFQGQPPTADGITTSVSGAQPAPGLAEVERKLSITLNALQRIDRTRRTVVDQAALWDIAQRAIGEVTDVDGQLPQPGPGSEAGEMRAVIDMIWRMCKQPGQPSVVVNGDRLAARITGLIKNSGIEPF